MRRGGRRVIIFGGRGFEIDMAGWQTGPIVVVGFCLRAFVAFSPSQPLLSTFSCLYHNDRVRSKHNVHSNESPPFRSKIVRAPASRSRHYL